MSNVKFDRFKTPRRRSETYASVNERLPGGPTQRKDTRADHEATRLRGEAPDEHGST